LRAFDTVDEADLVFADFDVGAEAIVAPQNKVRIFVKLVEPR
jgi:hypothetical protein